MSPIESISHTCQYCYTSLIYRVLSFIDSPVTGCTKHRKIRTHSWEGTIIGNPYLGWRKHRKPQKMREKKVGTPNIGRKLNVSKVTSLWDCSNGVRYVGRLAGRWEGSFFGQFMSPHHSYQTPQRSKASGSLFVCQKVKVPGSWRLSGGSNGGR